MYLIYAPISVVNKGVTYFLPRYFLRELTSDVDQNCSSLRVYHFYDTSLCVLWILLTVCLLHIRSRYESCGESHHSFCGRSLTACTSFLPISYLKWHLNKLILDKLHFGCSLLKSPFFTTSHFRWTFLKLKYMNMSF